MCPASRPRIFLALALLGLSLEPLRAEWTTQTVTLHPGWNSVFLEVSPAANDIQSVFTGIPVKSVWRSYSEQASPQYIDDSTIPKPDPDRWLTWVPGATAQSVIQTLNKVHGGWAYLIELAGDADVEWSVVGRPVVRDLSWVDSAYSITGLCVDPAIPTTFAEFFGGSAAHQGIDIRKLNAAGEWVKIPTSTLIDRNKAYWIYSNGISSFQGDGCIEVDDRGLLDFGAILAEQQLVLCNNTSTDANYSLEAIPSTLPDGTASSGDVALSIWQDGSNGNYGWLTLDGVKSVAVPGNSRKEVRLSIRRNDMAPSQEGNPYFGILRVTGQRICRNIGLRANSAGSSAGARHAGLWAGYCVLSSVNEPGGGSPDVLQPTASEASLRLLLRVASDGSVSLLREAYVLWLDGLTDGDGNVVEPGRFLVAGSLAEVAQFEATHGALGAGRLKGAAVRDGFNVPRRFSSVGFSFDGPQAVGGAFDPLTGTLSGTITIGYNDDLNPYKHRYHPDHDNLKDGTGAQGAPEILPEGKESYTITRQITLQFEGSDPEDLRFLGGGDTVAGGSYFETITGLHRASLKTGGTFRISRVVAE